MTHAFHRSLLKTPRRAVRGDGVYIIDDRGKRYLDGSGGAAVSCIGHSHARIVQAIEGQLHQLPYAHSAFFTTGALEELADRLVSLVPGMDLALLLSGGSEAVEAALKLSRQYFVEIGQPSRRLFVARRQSYHGNTLGALGVGGNEWRRKMFAPLLAEGHHIAPCFEYRERGDDESRDAYGLRVANELESMLERVGSENVAAFVAETVVGATAGAVTAVPGYFQRIREICDAHGIHLILDEVMCGSGRTGTFAAYEQEGIIPDIVTMAKGLAGGYQPVGVLLCREAIADAIRSGSGFFQHGHTFMGHATASAAALATLDVIRDDRLLSNVVSLGDYLRDALWRAFRDNPHVGDVRGRGLFIGVEFVLDREAKEPFDPKLEIHKQIQRAALDAGLLVYGMGGTIDGQRGNHVLIAPPYNATESHAQELVHKLGDAVRLSLEQAA